MLKFITAFALLFNMSQVFASDLTVHFNSLVKPSALQDEFRLELEINANSTMGEELKKIFSHIDTLEDLSVADVEIEGQDKEALVNAAISKLDLDYDGFFCSAFIGFDDNADYETGKCQEKVRELLRPFFSMKGLYRAKAVHMERNNWGDEISSYLLLEDQKNVYVLFFDIVHEI